MKDQKEFVFQRSVSGYSQPSFLRKLDTHDPIVCVCFTVVLHLTAIEMIILSKFDAALEGLGCCGPITSVKTGR